MKKIIFTTLFFSLFVVSVFAQVGIGTNTPNASSVLDLTSTSKAFLPPRMNTAARDAIQSPVAGMVIFNTTTNCIELYRGSGWYNMCTGGTALLPTITSFTPSSGPVGTSVTITGTNLTSATVKFNNTTASVSVNTATSITCTVPSGATTGNITATTTDGTATSASVFTVTGGVLTSNEVAKSNLIAHWRFDDSKIEDTSGVLPFSSTGTQAYVTGKIGKALQFTGAQLIYPTIAKINNATALQNGFTLSMWVQLPSNTTNYSPLWQVNGNIGDIFGLVGLAFRKNGDVFDFDGALTHVNGTGTHSTGFGAHLEGSSFSFASATWAFITMTYDDATRKISYYGNGTKIGEKAVDVSVIPALEKFELVTTASNPGVSISQVSFGALNTNPPFTTGPAPASWQNSNLTGVVDDVRLFNKALSGTEISDLYTRGSAGN
ncbi:IPT/TIG domain-containing protein [Ferruginibacter lapsinanis]|uniref:IPT/TIG domain-containing protein n=1 Tax=Ferruginibacter lapsinanis TaxID=563172 RepID=UPI001E58DDA1|nr:IPT/TIG domain-containing protein [Ferruginibacter lapsinanis]UEG49079.1 IPT/TIG domain-containing protein [Ferruginibacter lapsinanis]